MQQVLQQVLLYRIPWRATVFVYVLFVFFCRTGILVSSLSLHQMLPCKIPWWVHSIRALCLCSLFALLSCWNSDLKFRYAFRAVNLDALMRVYILLSICSPTMLEFLYGVWTCIQMIVWRVTAVVCLCTYVLLLSICVLSEIVCVSW